MLLISPAFALPFFFPHLFLPDSCTRNQMLILDLFLRIVSPWPLHTHTHTQQNVGLLQGWCLGSTWRDARWQIGQDHHLVAIRHPWLPHPQTVQAIARPTVSNLEHFQLICGPVFLEIKKHKQFVWIPIAVLPCALSSATCAATCKCAPGPGTVCGRRSSLCSTSPVSRMRSRPLKTRPPLPRPTSRKRRNSARSSRPTWPSWTKRRKICSTVCKPNPAPLPNSTRSRTNSCPRKPTSSPSFR